jgi:hypothetical protein
LTREGDSLQEEIEHTIPRLKKTFLAVWESLCNP